MSGEKHIMWNVGQLSSTRFTLMWSRHTTIADSFIHVDTSWGVGGGGGGGGSGRLVPAHTMRWPLLVLRWPTLLPGNLFNQRILASMQTFRRAQSWAHEDTSRCPGKSMRAMRFADGAFTKDERSSGTASSNMLWVRMAGCGASLLLALIFGTNQVLDTAAGYGRGRAQLWGELNTFHLTGS